MKLDALTLAAGIFLIGVLATSVSASDLFKRSNTAPASELQIGVAAR